MNKLLGLNLFNIKKTYDNTLQTPFRIEGVLSYKKGNQVKVLVGQDKMIHAVLKEKMTKNVGDHVKIDPDKIISMKICDRYGEDQKTDYDEYKDLLKEQGVPLTKDSLGAVDALENLDMPVSKEAVESITASKKCFKTIQENLDHHTATELIKKDIDVENDSIQKVADGLLDIKKQQEESVSPWKFFKKNEKMSTEKAQKMAHKLYGTHMGKDVLDSIKALHEARIKITKENVERIYDLFYKLSKIKDLSDEVLIKGLKDERVPSIEGLYEEKYKIKQDSIPVSLDQSNTKIHEYEQTSIVGESFKKIKGAIKEKLKDLGLYEKQYIELSEKMIKSGVGITKENLDRIMDTKGAIHSLNSELDPEKACWMIKEGIEVEKEDVKKVSKIMSVWKQYDFFTQNNKGERKLATFSDEVIHKGIDKLSSIQSTLKKVPKLSVKQVAHHLASNIPLTFIMIQKNFKNVKPIKDIVLPSQDTVFLEPVLKKYEPKKILQACEALKNYGLSIHPHGIQKTMESEKTYEKIKRMITPKIILESIEDEKDLENMKIDEVKTYLDKKLKENQYSSYERLKHTHTQDPIKSLTEYVLTEKNLDRVFGNLLKRNMEFTLKDMKALSQFLNQEKQVGHQMSRMMGMTDFIKNGRLKEEQQKIEKKARKISKKIKRWDESFKEDYKALIQDIKNLQNQTDLFYEDHELLEIFKRMRDSYEFSKKMKAMNLPIDIGDTFTNLQVYTPNEVQNLKDESLHTFINLDAPNLGKVQIMVESNEIGEKLHIKVESEWAKKRLENEIHGLIKDLIKQNRVLQEVSFEIIGGEKKPIDSMKSMDAIYGLDLKI